MKKVIIDTDPGIDDAIALACAFRQKKYEISLIVASAGNLNTNITSKNCMDLCYYFGRHFPVAKGADLPVSGIITITAADVHGNNGLGGIPFPDSPYLTLKEPAKDAMYRMLIKNSGASKKCKTEIWLLGPATNIALMLADHPDAVNYISRIVMMGGSIEGVNNSLEIYDEFNILYDPLAMKQVIAAQIPIVFVPMEIGHNCYISHEEIEKFAKMNGTTARFARMMRVYHDTHTKNLGAAQHDAAVIYYALYPHRFKKRNVFVHINLDGKIISQLEFSISPHKTNYVLCFNTDAKKFKKWLFKSFENLV